MAKISYEASNQMMKQNSNNGGPSFFSLKNDGDEAIVRFMHDSVDSFELVTVHKIQTENGRFRNVSCLREDGREPLDNCPFCKAGMPIDQRFYIHLINYVKDEAGNITPQPMIWERSVKYAQNLKGYIDNYGPLSNVMCKIIRHGRPGEKTTTYDIIPNVQTLDVSKYPKIEGAFEGYNVVGNAVMSKTFNELDCYVKTGQFPPKEDNVATTTSQPIPPAPFAPSAASTSTPAFQQAPYIAPVSTTPINAPFNPYAGTQGNLNAPVRYL